MHDNFDDFGGRGRGGFRGRGRGGGPIGRRVQRQPRYFERMRRQNMFQRQVNLLDIDRPEVEIEVPEWIADAEEILEAQEKA